MGFIPFFCCFKKFSPKVYAIAAIVFNGLKLLLSISNIAAFGGSTFKFANVTVIIELLFIVTNVVNAIIILVNLINKNAFNKTNKLLIILCIVSLIITGIGVVVNLVVFIFLFVISVSVSFFWILILIDILIVLFEVINFLCFNYLYKLLKLKADSSYDEYIKNGNPIEQNSVTQTNIQVNQNQPVLSTTLPNNIVQQNTDSNSNAKV